MLGYTRNQCCGAGAPIAGGIPETNAAEPEPLLLEVDQKPRGWEAHLQIFLNLQRGSIFTKSINVPVKISIINQECSN